MAMVVIGDTCVQRITAVRTIPEALSFIVAILPEAICCCHGDGGHVCSKLSGYYVGSCLRLVAVIGSDGRHVCTKYHGHTYILLSATYRLLCWKRCHVTSVHKMSWAYTIA